MATEKVPVYISFDYDHDSDLKTLLVDPLRLSHLIPHVGRLMRTPARDAPDRDVGRGR
jgi:hypothetical protein